MPHCRHALAAALPPCPCFPPQATTLTRSSLASLYWTIPQMIAHYTAGGCNLRPGDLIATGTLSTEVRSASR